MERKYYVEPMTVVAVAQAAYKLWSGSQEARQRKEIVKLLKQINEKLDIIIRKQNQILAELRSMQIQFRIDLRNEFIKSLEVDLFAYQSELNVEVGRLESTSNRDSLVRIAALAQPLRLISFRFMGYGLPAFTGAIGSALLLSSIYALMRSMGANVRKVDAEELSFLNEWDSRLAEWLKPESGDGIVAAVNITRAERLTIEMHVSDHPRRVFLEWFDTGEEYYPSSRRSCQVHQERFLVINGDLQTGFSDVYESGRVNPQYRCNTEPWNRHGPAVGAVSGDIAPSFESRSLAVSKPEYDPENPFEIPETDEAVELSPVKQSYYANAGYLAFGSFGQLAPVNHPITQALNQKREEWIAILERESNLMSLQKIITGLSDRIRERRGSLKSEF